MEQYRTKMYIEFDEEKIIKEGKYILKNMKEIVNKACEIVGIHEDDKAPGFYVNGSFETFGSVVLWLQQQDWFLYNIKTWLWYNSDDQAHIEDYVVEDLAKHYREQRGINDRACL